MNLIDLAIKQLYKYIDAQVASARVFRAIVTGQSGGMVQIRRLYSTTGETALRARLAGFDLATNDEVLCAEPVDGMPVVIGVIQRAAAASYLTLPGGLKVSGSSGSGIFSGSGSPETVVTAPIGSKYFRTDANGGVQEYTKVSGTGNTGWLPSVKASRRRVVREIVSYEGASTSSSFVSKGFQNTPTITANASANADDSFGWWLGHATTASSSNVASVVGGTNSGVQARWSPDLSVAFKTGSSVTSVRYWIGLFSSTPSASDDPAVDGFGFRFSTSASDSNWQAWSNDGSGGGTITDTGVAIGGAGTSFELRAIVNSDATAIDFYIDGVRVARHTTNLPTTTTVLNYGIYCTTLTASARQLRWGRITLENKP